MVPNRWLFRFMTPVRHGGPRISRWALVTGFATALAVPAPVAPQESPSGAPTAEPEARRLLTPDDYGRFESIGAASLSSDGRWLAAAISRVDEDVEVRFGPTSGGDLRVVEHGARFEFADDGAWIAVAVQPSREERRRLERDRGQVRNELALLATGSDVEHRFERVQSFAFSPDGRFLLMRKYRSGDGDARGTDIVVRELSTGTDMTFGNVAQSEWASEGSVLAMVVDAEGRTGNGIRVFDASTGRIRSLRSEPHRFTGLVWRDDSRDLAVLRVEPDSVRGDTVHSVLAWRNASEDGATAHELSGLLRGPDGSELRVSDGRGLRWAEDGSRLFFGVRDRPEERDETVPTAETEGEDDEGDPTPAGSERRARSDTASSDEDVPGVEIWHSRDVDPVPQQRVRANQERNRSGLAQWPLAGDAVVLGGLDLEESITVGAGDAHAVLTDEAPYQRDRMFGPAYRDYYRVDLASGTRTLEAERVEHYRGESPSGRYLVTFRDDHFWVYDRDSGADRNVTAELPTRFTNDEVDVVVPQKPPYGVGGWTDDDRHVLLYDRYDIWRVAPDGSGGERITRGAEDDVRHRLVRVDPDEDAFPVDGPWWVALYGEWTKQSGYGRVAPGGDVERLVWEDRSVSRLMRSERGETFAFFTQRFDEPPVVRVSGADLRSPRTVVATNAFAGEFRWGRSELIDYNNEWGQPLQAALFYPADYEPGRTYPMIVYHYERRSQVLHQWSNPSDRNAYNTTVFTQNGYFVLQPDIVYRPRNPGLSFMESVLPALDAALATGMIDAERVGITGHSWGGYQTTFAVTQTDRFAAAVAGAPLTNLVSMYLSFYWNSGGTDARIFEISQGRMEVPWWEDHASYIANSPVHHIERMSTPLLMAFGTEDGAVEFNQGVEFYNAARRADKDFVLLVYDGENHSLRERPNQVDYHRRSIEWFNHYLKGDPAPAWITDGVRYLDQQEKLKAGPAAGRVPMPTPTTVDDGSGGALHPGG